MPGLVADVNIEGQVLVLIGILETAPWIDLWRELNMPVYALPDLNLSKHVSDLDLWLECQRRDIVLLTANRNLEGDDSLEATIRRLNTPSSLPVLTLSDAERILRDKQYARGMAESLLARLMEIESYRGTGRIYIP